MQIFVDADACPVVGIVEKMAEKYNIPTTLLCDTNHVLYSDYSEVIVVGAGADAVDYKLISICHKGDIVVSQDYGVAAMALGKAAEAQQDEEIEVDIDPEQNEKVKAAIEYLTEVFAAMGVTGVEFHPVQKGEATILHVTGGKQVSALIGRHRPRFRCAHPRSCPQRCE